MRVADDGVQVGHPEIKDQYVAAASWDVNDNDPDPSCASLTTP
jgi:subtilisin family serine protease